VEIQDQIQTYHQKIILNNIQWKNNYSRLPYAQ
jgi:hypothetical protein